MRAAGDVFLPNRKKSPAWITAIHTHATPPADRMLLRMLPVFGGCCCERVVHPSNVVGIKKWQALDEDAAVVVVGGAWVVVVIKERSSGS
jgi:hypothetical protein